MIPALHVCAWGWRGTGAGGIGGGARGGGQPLHEWSWQPHFKYPPHVFYRLLASWQPHFKSPPHLVYRLLASWQPHLNLHPTSSSEQVYCSSPSFSESNSSLSIIESGWALHGIEWSRGLGPQSAVNVGSRTWVMDLQMRDAPLRLSPLVKDPLRHHTPSTGCRRHCNSPALPQQGATHLDHRTSRRFRRNWVDECRFARHIPTPTSYHLLDYPACPFDKSPSASRLR